jgi:hypothetical protein
MFANEFSIEFFFCRSCPSSSWPGESGGQISLCFYLRQGVIIFSDQFGCSIVQDFLLPSTISFGISRVGCGSLSYLLPFPTLRCQIWIWVADLFLSLSLCKNLDTRVGRCLPFQLSQLSSTNVFNWNRIVCIEKLENLDLLFVLISLSEFFPYEFSSKSPWHEVPSSNMNLPNDCLLPNWTSNVQNSDGFE